ncbi:MAG: putative zinc-binding protein [Planctomycetota bacterium]|jgi:uncharacterized metal-binding protein
MEDSGKGSGGGAKLIFACSGAADVGEIADRAARKLTADGVVKMFCLAGVGGRVSGIMKGTEAASKIIAIDGCALDCARHCLEEAGFSNFAHFRVTDMGLEKGNTPVNDDNIATVAWEVAASLAN